MTGTWGAACGGWGGWVGWALKGGEGEGFVDEPWQDAWTGPSLCGAHATSAAARVARSPLRAASRPRGPRYPQPPPPRTRSARPPLARRSPAARQRHRRDPAHRDDVADAVAAREALERDAHHVGAQQHGTCRRRAHRGATRQAGGVQGGLRQEGAQLPTLTSFAQGRQRHA
jgi:hypothetical protein